MENKFTKRFKSSMKLSKGSFIFENLVPIDKTLKQNQIHNEISLSSKITKVSTFSKIFIKKESKDQPKLDYNQSIEVSSLPPIKNPDSVRSHSRIFNNKIRLKLNDSVTPCEILNEPNNSTSPIDLQLKYKLGKLNGTLQKISMNSPHSNFLSKDGSYTRRNFLRNQLKY